MPNIKMSKKKMSKAIIGSLGMVTTIAAKAGVNRMTIYRFLKKYPEFREDMEMERDKILDRAESVLFEKVNKKDWKATEFILNKLGGKRGYAAREIHDTRVSGQLTGESFADAWDIAQKEIKEEAEAKANEKTGS